MDFEFFEGFLCRVALLSFNFLLLLFSPLLQVCEPEGLDLLFSVKSLVQLWAISMQVLLYGSLVFGEL